MSVEPLSPPPAPHDDPGATPTVMSTAAVPDASDALVADPATLLGRGWRRLAQESALRADPAQIASFRTFARAGDPPADAVVDAIATGNGRAVRAAVEQAFARELIADPAAPQPVVDFFAGARATPYWVDLAKVRAGQEALARVGIFGLFSLGSLALMGGYLARRAIKPLMRTGELEAMAPRRLAETAAWWLEVTTPGSLEPGGPGVEAALRVRLTHAHVRRWMHRQEDWDYEAWDDPVNQIQLAGTHLLFSVACMGGLQRLGLHYTAAEREAIMHLWRYLGWLSGIDEALLPATEADGWRLFWLMAATEMHPDEDSLALAQALLKGSGLAARDVPGPLIEAGLSFNAGMSRYLLGDEACDALGLPRSRTAKLAVKAMTRAVSTVELGRRVVPGGTLIAGLIGGHARRHLVESLAADLQADRSYSRDHTRSA